MSDHQTLAAEPVRPVPAAPSGAARLLQRTCACGQHTSGGGECEACRKRRDGMMQRSAVSTTRGVDTAPSIVHDVLRSGGRPLDPSTRTMMEGHLGEDLGRISSGAIMPKGRPGEITIGEPGDRFEMEADRVARRIGSAAEGEGRRGDWRYDLSRVRVHTGAQAAASARAVNAQAYTVGSDIVFGEGAYAPETRQGRELLAHELAHVVQQGEAPAALQRTLRVDTSFGGLPAPDQVAHVNTLVQALCDDFEVQSSGSYSVESISDSCDTPDAVAAGSKAAGCCCLCLMTNSPNDWRIRLSDTEWPHTSPGVPEIVIASPNTVTTAMHWTDSTAGAERRVVRPPVITFGHELCGHAALMEIGAHPVTPRGGRTGTDVHDPTVRVERLIWGEQGLPASDQRGLATGLHHGESIRRITVSGFPLNSSSVTALPAAERSKLTVAANFITTNRLFVDVFGHSDPVGSISAKQSVSDARATSVRNELVRLASPTVPTFTRVAGVSDSQPLSAATPHDQWRRADIMMTTAAAGAEVPPGGRRTPTHVPEPPTAAAAKSSSDACVALLANAAWP